MTAPVIFLAWNALHAKSVAIVCPQRRSAQRCGYLRCSFRLGCLGRRPWSQRTLWDAIQKGKRWGGGRVQGRGREDKERDGKLVKTIRNYRNHYELLQSVGNRGGEDLLKTSCARLCLRSVFAFALLSPSPVPLPVLLPLPLPLPGACLLPLLVSLPRTSKAHVSSEGGGRSYVCM